VSLTHIALLKLKLADRMKLNPTTIAVGIFVARSYFHICEKGSPTGTGFKDNAEANEIVQKCTYRSFK
jgi:hypothetical protein